MDHPDHETVPASLLPEPGLEGLRLTRAQVARLLGCSKTAVTEWTRKGILTFGGDDRTPAVAAVRQLFERGDVRRLRVRVLREVARDFTTLRATIAALRASLAAEPDRTAAAIDRAQVAFENMELDHLEALTAAIDAQFDAATAAHARGDLRNWIAGLVDGLLMATDEPAPETSAPADSGDSDSSPEEYHDGNEPPAPVGQ